jgi:hypothetical protein
MTRWLILPLAVSIFGGCSPIVETRISSIGQANLVPAGYSFSEPTPSTTELRSAQRLVSDNLRTRGFVVSDNALLHVEVTLAVRPASLALGTASGPGSLATAKRKKLLQNCEDREFRIGIALTRVSDGTLLYQGSAAEYHCNMSLTQAIPDLVVAALTDLGKPRGRYAVERKAQD